MLKKTSIEKSDHWSPRLVSRLARVILDGIVATIDSFESSTKVATVDSFESSTDTSQEWKEEETKIES